MESKYTKSWEAYKEACEEQGRPVQSKEEAYMQPVLEDYNETMHNFILSLLL